MKAWNKILSLIFILTFAAGFFSSTGAVGVLYSRPRFSTDQYQKMWIKSVTTTVDIQEQIAVTHVDQIFNNELNTSVEAIYVFPLPDKATITQLVYWVNGQRFEASIRERQQAVNDYNDKLRRWMDPALLEYLGNNLFRLSIVPINANTDVRTEITYVEPLTYDLGKVSYTFQLNTLGLSSKPLQTVSVNVEASSQFPFKSFTSPTHSSSSATKITKIDDKHYTLFYGDENYYPDKDLKIVFEIERSNVDFSILTYKPSEADSIGADGYYAIWITPPDNVTSDETIPKNIIFTADVSSSMEGERITQVKEALDDFLNLLNPGDKFNIITFGTFVNKFKPDMVAASTDNIIAAQTFVLQMSALGMTNIDEALTESLSQSFGDSTSNDLVFLTDGLPTWGETNADSILARASRNNVKEVRIFPFGVGSDVSKSLLTSLAAQNHGYAKFIASDDSIALVVSDHFMRISKPVLTDIQVDMGGLQAYDQYPKIVNDLFWGSQVVQYGMYKAGGTYNVVLRGKIRSNPVEYTQSITFPDTIGGHRFVPRLWAMSKIDNILQLIAMYGEKPELVDQVVELGLRYQIVTPYTAFYVDPTNPSTGIETDKTTPKDFTLEQNYPNPFNPETVIGFRIPELKSSYHVILRIYNSLGQLVKVLVDEYKSSGSYKVVWDGRDSGGNVMPSGIYFYSIQIDGFKQIKKMVLLR